MSYEQKGGSPQKNVPDTENRRARNHPILLLSALGTNKNRERGINLEKNIQRAAKLRTRHRAEVGYAC